MLVLAIISITILTEPCFKGARIITITPFNRTYHILDVDSFNKSIGYLNLQLSELHKACGWKKTPHCGFVNHACGLQIVRVIVIILVASMIIVIILILIISMGALCSAS